MKVLQVDIYDGSKTFSLIVIVQNPTVCQSMNLANSPYDVYRYSI